MCTCGVAGPQEADASEQSLVALLQGQELQVRSIAFDSPHGADQKRTAFVRLMPPPLPWRSAEQEVRSPGPLWATAQLPHGRGMSPVNACCRPCCHGAVLPPALGSALGRASHSLQKIRAISVRNNGNAV